MNISLRKVFNQIGMSNKHATVYETLLASTSMTPLKLARATRLNRSSLYRYLEELRERGLVELILRGKSSSYTSRPEGLSQYLVHEEERLEKLKTTIPNLLSEMKRVNNKESEVKFYQGVEGLKQMLWNVVSSRSEFVGLGYADWNESVGITYAEKLRQKVIENKTLSREIQNDPSMNFDYTKLGEDYKKFYVHRVIDKSLLEIKHDTYIYGGVFAYYYHYQGEYFGVEIHNKEIARSERQMFEILWKMAKQDPDILD